MPITIYGTKDCDTMKKARAWLDSHGVAYGFHDYKTEGSTYGSKATNGIPRALLHGWLVRPATTDWTLVETVGDSEETG